MFYYIFLKKTKIKKNFKLNMINIFYIILCQILICEMYIFL